MNKLEKIKPLGLLLLRLALAAVFISHGWPKLFGNPQQWASNFVKMGFPAYFSYIAGVLETIGGGLLAVGLFTRIAGSLLAIEMGVALWRVDFHNAPSLYAVNAYQISLLLCSAALALATTGAGLLSLDYAIFREKA